MKNGHNKPIWEPYLSKKDKMVFEAAGFGANSGMGERPVLLVIDVNYNFCGDKRETILESVKRWKLSCGEAAWDALPVISKIINVAREQEIPIIYTTGFGRADKWDRGAWSWKNQRKEEISITQSNTRNYPDGNVIMEQITPKSQDIVVWKQKPSAFHEAPLQSNLQLLKADSIILTGTTTSGCVRATAVDAFSHNYRVSIVEDACFDRVDISHAVSLLDLQAKYADVLNSNETIKYLRTIPAGKFDLPKGD